MTHGELIDSMLRKTATKQFHENRWGARHCAAFREPQPLEAGIVGMLRSAAIYADYHQSRFGSKIGDDGVLGPAWRDILLSVRTLLNGELGRLDGGTLDSLILDMLAAEGLEEP